MEQAYRNQMGRLLANADRHFASAIGRGLLPSLINYGMISSLVPKLIDKNLMEIGMKRIARWMYLVVLGLLLPLGAQSQDFPKRPVRIVVPYPPGGVVDISGRLLAQDLSQQLGVPVVVENKVGAGGTIGAAQAARSPADGYTVLLSGAATHAFGPWIYKQLPYDPVKDFVAVTQFSEGPLALVVNATSPINTLDDFVRSLKAGGASINYGSNGNGTYPHLAAELMNTVLGGSPQHVPYPGGAQTLNALLAGEIQFTLNHLPVVQAHVRSGRLRMLATTGNARSPVFPSVPTLKESGYDIVASAWFGLFAPAGTPPAVVERLHQATAAAARSPALREKLAGMGDEVLVEGPARFQTFQIAELEKWRRIIERAGLKPN
jgi:tripartite-type tricarboxylate transporter receptor subunit TctC